MKQQNIVAKGISNYIESDKDLFITHIDSYCSLRLSVNLWELSRCENIDWVFLGKFFSGCCLNLHGCPAGDDDLNLAAERDTWEQNSNIYLFKVLSSLLVILLDGVQRLYSLLPM